jgi:hypothetical protein
MDIVVAIVAISPPEKATIAMNGNRKMPNILFPKYTINRY